MTYNHTSDNLGRRTFVRGAVTAGVLAFGVGAASSSAAATEGCCRVCWVDVKPDSCPNSINPDNNGVVTVAAGWPRFVPGTVKLVPVKGEYDAAFDGCQNYRDPEYHPNCGALNDLLDGSDGRSAEPFSQRVEDVDGDGDDDTLFKFRTEDLELESDDAYLILVGESTRDGCRVVGIDSVRVLDGGGGSANGQANGRANGRGR